MTEETKKRVILLVEDDRFVSDIYKRKLGSEGYEVVSVSDGRDALQILEGTSPDAVLLDIMMPIVDGMEVLKRMKGEDRWKKIPVIMLTNLAEKDSIEKSLAMGADGYIIKAHFTPSEVVQKIKNVLDNE